MDESITWAVDDLSQILAWADMEAVLKDFGTSTGKADPVVHFYETFLKEYDPKTREMRGVYYTPLPVVSYIVRSIDHILKTSFEKPQGLADPSVLVLDPAVGTATFLYMVMQEIHDAVINQGQKGTWDDYVKDKLLPRLFGFELLMAPYAIAHLKMGRLLKETGYQFQTDQRLGIYLTNTLEEAVKHSDTMFAQWITEEANAAAEIKKNKPIMVVLGNPPYSGESSNKGAWARQLIEPYKMVDGKPLGDRNPKWLNNDYVKFIAFGQWRVGLTGQGVLGFITSNSYLNSPTHRGMRQSLMNTFTDIFIFNLHGNANKKEVALDGSKDENVFDITEGVTIALFLKELGKMCPAIIHYDDLWGQRESKYHTLLESDMSTTGWKQLNPTKPYWLFVPRNEAQLDEYEKGWKVTDIFILTGEGFTSARDDFAIAFTFSEVEKRLKTLVNTLDSDETVRETFNLHDTGTWKLSNARKALNEELKNDESMGKVIHPCLYRPFDKRFCLLNDNIMERPRIKTQYHMMKLNLALSTIRNIEIAGGFTHVLCVAQPMDRHAVSIKEINYLFPLYLYPAEGEMHLGEGRRPNLNPEFIKVFSEKLGLKFIEDGKGALQTTFGPEDIFNYAYSVFHSPSYRSRYAEFLKIDFPRLPLTSDKALFKSLVEKGAVLVALHLMESPLLDTKMTRYEVKGEHEVEKVSYYEKTQRVSINRAQYFEGVPPEVWNFHIGGYQVCEKWLKDRKGRKLTINDIDHYQKIVVALKETIRLMSEIDEAIEEHGGWPVAFE